MGICQSKRNMLSHLDDSVKVMVRHDAKALEQKGQAPGGFVPRASHPLMDDGGNSNIGYGNEHENVVRIEEQSPQRTGSARPLVITSSE
mmetsp:Transcript_16526/g.24793  ORF Transcript_16526/g.24793 Transcript_16526/m.24793 type:complete len:89 (+) Transcript_16526:322-588(+)|eukprot:CAMPEP_0194074028 /NCGR_PEP_ID=MMETSP0149-20130528/1232_1 /TAXON_ID=122233 /ORGANISM="Chaetoceros debilis, Strain MM31A-1" /LENGTH=88 /DNA_ID=CAMNT_0038754119 /DNA_START=288 /DNA_END=554 /DNA_ORIENTATION=-